MMTQGALPFKYEGEERTGGLTSLGGLPIYMEALHQMGLKKWVEKHVQLREMQGWKDWQMVTSIMLLNIAGGECVDDLSILSADEGFCRVLERAGMQGMRRKERRELERRFRKRTERIVPSASAVRRYLDEFHNSQEEGKRREGKAFIPEANEHLSGLTGINGEMLAFVQKQEPKKMATLDMDATLIETTKRSSLYCYKRHKAYQPLNVYWVEQDVVAHTEFRDGNVPAGYEQLRILKETLERLPEGVEEVRMRSDTAGYQKDLLKYCEQGKNERFGRIEFAAGCDVTPHFKLSVKAVPQEDWVPILEENKDGKEVPTGKEWAEVNFVSNGFGTSKKGTYRFLATREVMSQPPLPGMEGQLHLPFQTMTTRETTYKIFGIVTNMDWEGERVVKWLYERCGRSEEIHAIMKEDLAGGRLPSEKFGANAAWWWIMVLSLNLNQIMKRHVFGGSWRHRRMKAIRFHLINISARVVEHSRQLIIKLSKSHPGLDTILHGRRAIVSFAHGPPSAV